jgi:hypothetical protein
MPVSDGQREAITTLLREGRESYEIAVQVGVTTMQVAAIRAHLTRGSYARGDAGSSQDSGVADAIEATFGLEKDLQMALRRNIQQLEPALTIVDGDREQTVASGRVDITARDEDGTIVAIELKTASADRDAIGQILSYIGDLMETEEHVRGILVAREFTPRAIAAARSTPHLRLVRYGFQFTFEISGGKV